MIYIRDNGGSHSDWSVEFIHSDQDHEHVLALLKEPWPNEVDYGHKPPVVGYGESITWCSEAPTVELADLWRVKSRDWWDEVPAWFIMLAQACGLPMDGLRSAPVVRAGDIIEVQGVAVGRALADADSTGDWVALPPLYGLRGI